MSKSEEGPTDVSAEQRFRDHVFDVPTAAKFSGKADGDATLAATHRPGNTKRGKYHCTVDLLFDWIGLVCLENNNINCQLLYR